MTYTLVALFVLTGKYYVEMSGLTLHQCAGHAAIIKQKTRELEPLVGEVRYICLNGGSIAKQ